MQRVLLPFKKKKKPKEGRVGRISQQLPNGLGGRRGQGLRNSLLISAAHSSSSPPKPPLSLPLSFPGYEMRINICLRDEGVVRINWLVLWEAFEDERHALQMLSKLITCLVLMSQVKPVGCLGINCA